MERNLIFGTSGCFLATIVSIFLIKYNPSPLIPILLPMWGLVFGVALARVVDIRKK